MLCKTIHHRPIIDTSPLNWENCNKVKKTYDLENYLQKKLKTEYVSISITICVSSPQQAIYF